MPQAFLSSALSSPSLQVTLEPDAESGREIIRILVIGPAYGVERIIHELFRLGFAEVREWSKPQPTGRTHEVMRVLTRYMLAPTVINHR